MNVVAPPSLGETPRSCWGTCRLGDHIHIKHGFAFSGRFFGSLGPRIVLTPGNFYDGGGFKGKSDEKRYSGLIPEGYTLAKGDLIVAMTEQAEGLLGSAAFVPESNLYLHNQRLGLVQVRDETALDKHYLYYLFNSPQIRRQIQVSATGTKIRHTSPARMEAIRVLLPPLLEQRRIADVLGSLDDKIELNRRMNRTLEEMARAVFRAWFVDFLPIRAKQDGAKAFPGMDADTFALFPDSFEDSLLGPIPKDWQVRAFADLCDVNPSTSLPRGSVAPYLDMKNMPTTGPAALAFEHREFTGSGMKFRNGDVLIARITPCLENGKTALVDFLIEGVAAWGSTEYVVVRARPPVAPAFAYLLARQEPFRTFAIQQMTGTSGRQRFPGSALTQYMLAIPEGEILKAFAAFSEPLFAAITAKSNEARTLAATRDLLLPRLLAGGRP